MKTRDTFLEVDDLQKGTYYFVPEVDWIESTESHNFTVTSYGAGGATWEPIHDIDKNQVVRYAAEAIVANGEGVRSEPNAEDENIVKHTVDLDFGYEIICIKNGAESSAYKETVTFNSFEGLTLMEPESGMQYDVLVKAGITKIILIKQSCRGYSKSYSYSSSVQMGDDALIGKCLAEGEKTERATGIYVVKLQHSGGIIYVYKNETSKSTLNEELGFELTGLVIED